MPGGGSAPGSTSAASASRPHSAHLGPTQRGFATQRLIANLIPHLRSLPQPVIAAVNGPAAGGGFALVLGSRHPPGGPHGAVQRGVRPHRAVGVRHRDVVAAPRLVGVARAQELMLTGRIFDAEEAYRIGLVVDLVDDDTLLDAALVKAEEIMANSPFGVALTKEGMWSALEIPGMQAAIDLENRQQIMASATSRPPRGDEGLPRAPPPDLHQQLTTVSVRILVARATNIRTEDDVRCARGPRRRRSA